MSDWAIEAAERDSERQQLAVLRMKQAIQDRETFAAKSMVLIAQWRSVLGRKVDEFNSQPGKRGTLGVEADAESCRVWITGQPFSISGLMSGGTFQFTGKPPIRFNEAWRVKITPDRLDVWISDNKDAPVTTDEIANTVIEALLAARWQ